MSVIPSLLWHLLSLKQIVLKVSSIPTPVPLHGFVLPVCGRYGAVALAWVEGVPVGVQRCVPLEVSKAWALSFHSYCSQSLVSWAGFVVTPLETWVTLLVHPSRDLCG